jgi:hypothetical protein
MIRGRHQSMDKNAWCSWRRFHHRWLLQGVGINLRGASPQWIRAGDKEASVRAVAAPSGAGLSLRELTRNREGPPGSRGKGSSLEHDDH